MSQEHDEAAEAVAATESIMSAAQLRAQILGAEDREVEPVDCPEWKATIYIRSLGAKERDSYEAAIYGLRTKGGKVDVSFNRVNVRARLVVLSAVDASGNQIFTADDMEQLGTKNAAVLDRLFAVAQRLSGMRKEDVEELEGESEASPN